MISSLRRFSKEGAEDIYTNNAGEVMTNWEHNELVRQQRIAERNLRQEAKEFEQPISSGYSKAQMR